MERVQYSAKRVAVLAADARMISQLASIAPLPRPKLRRTPRMVGFAAVQSHTGVMDRDLSIAFTAVVMGSRGHRSGKGR